jgi:sulfite exporter TauE/SafE/copper chaperone CopZ
MKKVFSIKGMHCNSCAVLIEKIMKDKVNNISVSYAKETAEIDFDEDKISEKEIQKLISEQGYSCNCNTKEEKNKENSTDMKKKDWIIVAAVIAIVAVIILYKTVNLDFQIPDVKIPELGEEVSLIILFLAGLLTGFHCISMCGGFVVSYTAKNALNGYKGYKQHLVYGFSKVLSYAIIGGIFGLIGGIIAFNIGLRAWVAILAGLFMIFYSLSMFGFRFFRRFQFNPKFLTKAAASLGTKASGPLKAPFITGLLNGLFLACGPLQAMYLYAAGTGSFFTGATSLAVFGLGTLPVMLGFGSLASAISHKTTAKILKFSAIIVLILGLIMLNRGLTLIGSEYTLDNIKTKLTNNNAQIADGTPINIVNGVQEIKMTVDSRGYTPNSFVLKKGVPVKWIIDAQSLNGCNNEIISREYNIDIKLKNGINIVEFTPEKTGTFGFSCWMGMIRGNFIVTESGTASQNEIRASTPKSGGSCSMGSGGGSCGCGGSR